MELRKMGFLLDVVEIDRRIPVIAEKYFALNPAGMKIYIDDGRHFMRTTTGTYDIIAIDVLNGEVQPYHLFTVEAFGEMKNILAPDGLILINNQGYMHGEHGKGSRSIYKTLLESGFKVKYFTSEINEESGDIHFMASPVDLDFHLIDNERMNVCCRLRPHKYDELISGAPINIADAFVLSDNKPRLEKINIYENEKWRSNAISWILKRQTDNRIPFFN